ncbi:MAG: ribosome maturation factor RimM [Buchnera aphidicola (Meitanaphis flavogallis)]
MFSFTEKKQNIFNYHPWNIQNNATKTTIYVQNWKDKKKYFIVKIKNIIDRSTAQKLTNNYIIINENILPPLKNDDYYWKDIINCTVFNIKKKY